MWRFVVNDGRWKSGRTNVSLLYGTELVENRILFAKLEQIPTKIEQIIKNITIFAVIKDGAYEYGNFKDN